MTCPDCHVPLVETLPSKQTTSAFVRVLVTTDELELGVVKGFLKSHGIPFTTVGDPAEPYGSCDPGEMQLRVPPEHAETVKTEIAKRQGKRVGASR